MKCEGADKQGVRENVNPTQIRCRRHFKSLTDADVSSDVGYDKHYTTNKQLQSKKRSNLLRMFRPGAGAEASSLPTRG